MLAEILYSIALNSSGNLVHVRNADKGVDYFCPTPARRHLVVFKRSFIACLRK